MPHKSKIERHFSDSLDIIKRLWEHLNLADCLFNDIQQRTRTISESHSFRQILSDSLKTMTRGDLINSARDLRVTLIWKWGLIVAMAHFDAWMQEWVTIMHESFPSAIQAAKRKKYNFKSPSFSTDFFTKDKACLGKEFEFKCDDQLLKEFVKWKEMRNCLVHNAGCITKRLATTWNLSTSDIDKPIKISPDDIRDAFQSILKFMKDIQRRTRRKIRTST